MAVPTLDGLSRYGFSAKVLIKPRVWEANKIFKTLYGDRRPIARKLDPTIHFALLIRHMRQVASTRHYLDTNDAGPAFGATAQANP